MDVFARIREDDILVHHPYESFITSVQRFIEQAAADPDVLTIKMTLYRTSGDSPIVHSLIRAAESGKQVVVMVEIKARFDERANIVWARALERAGAHVAYGLLGLKTHSKCALVIRREAGDCAATRDIGTGNYNHRTARVYTDLGPAHARPRPDCRRHRPVQRAQRASRRKDGYRELLVAPVTIRSGIEALIDAEAERHRSHGDGASSSSATRSWTRTWWRAYRASQAGSPSTSSCAACARCSRACPASETSIEVRSIVGRYLEHSRIFAFGQGERERTFIGSADLMERNLDRRIEAMTPIKDAAVQARIREILAIMRRDDRRAWRLGPDGHWTRIEPALEGEPRSTRSRRSWDSPSRRPRRFRDGSRRGAPPVRARRGPAGPQAGQPREVELKYLVRDLEALRSWLAHDWGGALDGVESGDERTVEVEDRYVDTAYGALAQAGFAARLRREDGGPVSLTVKSTSRDRPAARRTPADAPPARTTRWPSRSGWRSKGPPTSAWTRTLAGERRSRAHQRGARRRPSAHASSPSTSAESGAPWRSTTGRCWSRSTGWPSSAAPVRWPPSPSWRSRPARAAAPNLARLAASSRPPAS